jgi:hypothetical protein
MKLIKDMTQDELRTALVWCMLQLREQWVGERYSETWGQKDSPWCLEAQPLPER